MRGPDWVSSLFFWIPWGMRFILSIKIPVATLPTTSNWVGFTKMTDKEIEILIIKDSDPGLGTQEYFQFGVYSPDWGRTMPHFSRKWPEWLSLHSLRDWRVSKKRGNWNWAGPCRAPRYKSFLCPMFQPPWPSLSSKEQIQTVANQGR